MQGGKMARLRYLAQDGRQLILWNRAFPATGVHEHKVLQMRPLAPSPKQGARCRATCCVRECEINMTIGNVSRCVCVDSTGCSTTSLLLCARVRDQHDYWQCQSVCMRGFHSVILTLKKKFRTSPGECRPPSPLFLELFPRYWIGGGASTPGGTTPKSRNGAW
jgi:hypothetical protein